MHFELSPPAPHTSTRLVLQNLRSTGKERERGFKSGFSDRKPPVSFSIIKVTLVGSWTCHSYTALLVGILLDLLFAFVEKLQISEIFSQMTLQYECLVVHS